MASFLQLSYGSEFSTVCGFYDTSSYVDQEWCSTSSSFKIIQTSSNNIIVPKSFLGVTSFSRVCQSIVDGDVAVEYLSNYLGFRRVVLQLNAMIYKKLRKDTEQCSNINNTELGFILDMRSFITNSRVLNTIKISWLWSVPMHNEVSEPTLAALCTIINSELRTGNTVSVTLLLLQQFLLLLEIEAKSSTNTKGSDMAYLMPSVKYHFLKVKGFWEPYPSTHDVSIVVMLAGRSATLEVSLNNATIFSRNSRTPQFQELLLTLDLEDKVNFKRRALSYPMTRPIGYKQDPDPTRKKDPGPTRK